MARSSTIVPARSRPKESKAWQVNRRKHCVADTGYVLQEKGYMKEKTMFNKVYEARLDDFSWLGRSFLHGTNAPLLQPVHCLSKQFWGKKKCQMKKIRDQCCAPVRTLLLQVSVLFLQSFPAPLQKPVVEHSFCGVNMLQTCHAEKLQLHLSTSWKWVWVPDLPGQRVKTRQGISYEEISQGEIRIKLAQASLSGPMEAPVFSLNS